MGREEEKSLWKRIERRGAMELFLYGSSVHNFICSFHENESASRFGSWFAYGFSKYLDTDHWFIGASVIVITVQKVEQKSSSLDHQPLVDQFELICLTQKITRISIS
jgi:hypothetical protein